MADISRYTIEYRVLAAAWYFECDRSIAAVKLLKTKLRERYGIEPPDARVITAWTDKLFSTGSILDRKRDGRPSERGDVSENVMDSLENHPTMSVRRRSDELGMSKSTVHRVLKVDMKLHPYKQVKVQFLSEVDREVRIEACRSILGKYDNELRRDKLLFSDECAVYAEGHPRAKQIFFWSKQNPFFFDQVRKHPPQVMIFAAMSSKHLIGPFFLEGGVTATAYISMLRNELLPELVRRGIDKSAHFQQDGAPAHTALITRNFLNRHFPDRWVGKFGPTNWPPRSPDLSSCDNALWGLLKPKIESKRAETVADLKQAIIDEFKTFDDRRVLEQIHRRSFKRMHLCIEHEGYQVEPFDQ